MSTAPTLAQRIKAEFDARTERLKTAQQEQLQHSQEREGKIARFNSACDDLKEVWQPRFAEFGKQFGEKIKITPVIQPSQREAKVAFLTETSIDLVADILPSLSVRAGYEILFMDSLVLAGENFNETSPYGNQGQRVPFVNDDGEMFYHGGHVGIEYIW